MVAVTDATLRTSVWENIFDAMAVSSDYAGVSPNPGFYRNNSDIDGDDTFPRVIVHPVIVDYEISSFARAHHNKELRVLIDVWAEKNKHLDLIGDVVSQKLLTTAFAGVHFIGSDEALTIETDANQKLHLRTISATFVRG